MFLYHCSRLFYLFQDTVTKYFHEETLFSCLAKLVPVLTVFILAALLGENMSLNAPVMYSCCTKASINWEEISNIYKKVSLLLLIMSVIGLGIHITILKKLKEVESQPSNHSWVISFNAQNGVNIAMTCPRKVFRHRRNLVSPEGSCASFIVSQIWILLGVYYWSFSISSLSPPIFHDYLVYMAPSRDFFLLNLIETVCSPALRNSLLDLIRFGFI